MKQKTPMQEIFEKTQELSELHFCDWLLENTDRLFKKEKEVMCEFADDYQRNCFQKSADDYFKETFNTKQK